MERLKGHTILIGKEPDKGRLLVAVGGKTAAIGLPGSVPNCVSRCKPAEGVAHARISIDYNGNVTIANLKPQNVTYVNGSEISTKRISTSAFIELGKDRFKINIATILDAAEKIAAAQQDIRKNKFGGKAQDNSQYLGGVNNRTKYNISHLRRVWEDYEFEVEKIARQQQEAGKKRMLPIMVGSLSSVASPILATLVAINTLWITLPVAVLSFGLYFTNYRRQDTSFEDKKAATERFTDDYVCPNPACNKFLGNISYKLLKRQYSMHCPYCKCEYVQL